MKTPIFDATIRRVMPALVRWTGLVGLLLLVSTSALGSLRSVIAFDEDASRDMLQGLNTAAGGPLPLQGPTVNQLGIWLGPHWYAFLALVLSLSKSTGTLLAVRWGLQTATVVLFFLFVRRLHDEPTAWVAALLLATSRVLAEVFAWYTHPMLAMPLAAGSLVVFQAWASLRRAWLAPLAALLAGLALQAHLAAAVLLPMLGVTSLFAGRLEARWAALTTGALLATFLPVYAGGVALPGSSVTGSSAGVEVSVATPFAVLAFLWLWRGGATAGWRRAVPGAAAAVVLIAWVVHVRRAAGPHHVAGWSLFNLRMGSDAPRLPPADAVRVIRELLSVLAEERQTQVGQLMPRMGLGTPLLVAGAALLVYRALRGEEGDRRKSRLLLSWLAVLLPAALLTGRDQAAGRYLLVAVLAACLLMALALTVAWRTVVPSPRAALSLSLLTAAALLVMLTRADAAWGQLRQVGLPGWLSPCGPGMLQSQALYDHLRSAGLSATEVGTRVHGLFPRSQVGVPFGSFAFIRAVLDVSGEPRPESSRTFRLVEPPGDGGCNGRPLVEPFEPALELEHVHVTAPATGEEGVVALPLRRPPDLHRLQQLPLLSPFPIGDTTSDLEFRLSRRPGQRWPARIELLAVGRGPRCRVEVELPGPRLTEEPERRPDWVHLAIEEVPESLETLVVEVHACRLETFDVWDAPLPAEPAPELPH